MKKKSFKRMMAALVAATMCIGMLGGCGGNGDSADNSSQGGGADSSDAGSSNEESKEQGESGKDKLVLTITIEGTAGSHESPVNDAFEALMSEKLGREIELNYNLISGGEYSDKAQMMFTTGDIGDIIQIPFLFDYSKAASEGMLLDISQYEEQFPNFFYYMDQTSAGIASVTMADGAIYAIPGIGLPRFPEDHGMLPYNVSTYRYDIFEKLDIKIPETIDEVYEAAKRLKEEYPDVYPINSRWKDLRSLYAANHTSNDIYWNGEEYVMGLFEEGYKDAIAFANKLYSEGLLDPEYISDDDDMLKSKEMTDKTFIVLGDWFTTPGEFTRLSSTGQIFAATLWPNNPKYGETAWQSIQPVNEIATNMFANYAVNANVADPEGTIEFLNHIFDDDVVRLLTWGIEGESYNLDADGNPVFVDEILNATDPWAAADAYGMRASKNMRPGFQLMDDSKAYVALAADDWLYYDGELHQEPIEQSEYYLSFPYPENDYIPPYYKEPVLTFTDEESQENGQIMTIYQTVRDEWQAALISGTKSMDEWDAYMEALKSSADINKLLENYNAAAKRYLDKANQ